MKPIYLDHNATTPTHPAVVEAMARAYGEGYANPASQHRPGQRARQVLEEAREQIAALLGADLTCPQPDRLIFTSGGTEANNLAILGAARVSRSDRPGHVVISAIEHASVVEPAEALLEEGYRLDVLGVDENGVVCADRLKGLFCPDTRVVSIILGNHETGVIQPIEHLAAVCNKAGVPLHTDAIQVAGKRPIHFRRLGVAAMSVAAHKFQGPLGIGGLLVRHDMALAPILYGGSQQWGLRPGTESVPLVVGMLTALQLWAGKEQEHYERLAGLRDRFEAGLKAGCPDLIIHGRHADRLPNTSSVAFPGLDAQVLLLALDTSGVACSVGAACSSGSTELSPTLRAMGLPNHVVASSLRFSLGATTTEADVDEAVRRILRVCGELGT